LSARRRPPKAWPPARSAARASVIDIDLKARAWPRHQGEATKYTVRVNPHAKRAGKKRICVWLYDYYGHLLARFHRRVGTKVSHTYSNPQPPLASWFARARKKKHGCEPFGV
jgi:hypothetical protein